MGFARRQLVRHRGQTNALAGRIRTSMPIRRDLDVLVERVLRRIVREANAAPASFTRTQPVTAPTQYPSHVSSPQTVPAARSPAEQQMSKDLAGQNVRNPKAAPMSQKTMKVNAVRKQLDAMGHTSTPEAAKAVTQNLAGWYDQLDPSDALVSTAQELAQRYAAES